MAVRNDEKIYGFIAAVLAAIVILAITFKGSYIGLGDTKPYMCKYTF